MGNAKLVFMVIGVSAMMLVAALLGFWMASDEAVGDSDVYFQYSTFSRLEAGGFDGNITIGQLSQHGDFGIGTIEGIDGEMIILDGSFYHARMDMHPVEIPSSTIVPFAMVAEFSNDMRFTLSDIDNYSEMREVLDVRLVPESYVYAVMIEAHFDMIRIRSVPEQQRPYPPLADVIANQSVMVLENVTGTMVGFRMPSGLGDINLPGYHLHFISDDLEFGGHVLEFAYSEAHVLIDSMEEMSVVFVYP